MDDDFDICVYCLCAIFLHDVEGCEKCGCSHSVFWDDKAACDD